MPCSFDGCGIGGDAAKGEYYARLVATARHEKSSGEGVPPPVSSASPVSHASDSTATTHIAEGVSPAAVVAPVPELAVLELSLAELVARGPPRPILLFLDGLSTLELAAVATALVRARAAAPRGSGGRMWLAATLAAPDDDDGPPELAPGLGEHVLAVRLPPLTKPESTCIIYSLARRHGPHLLDRPASVLMGLYKPQSSHPRCSLIIIACTAYPRAHLRANSQQNSSTFLVSV
jgi:hypothetical protein